MKSQPGVPYNKTMRRWVLGLLTGGALLFLYQNCSTGFTTLTSSELNSLSCGTKFQCDAGGNPIGKIVIDQLPASGYPTGSFSNARLDTKTLVVNDTGMISFLRLKLPDGMACQQTWLRGSYALQGGINTLELLGALQNMPCRTGDVPQENEFLDLLLRSGCFFVETSYVVEQDLSTGAVGVGANGTAVLDDDFARPQNPTARIRFRCELP
ncbi:MAG: hypothetical protein IPJ84_12240 [Bdellovibrionales bacterium]|nr:hypothetical protein [Bdellovibrionales bacterium]